MSNNALLIGNSDGIGLETTHRLLNTGWNVVGISRSESPVKHSSYKHCVADVTRGHFESILQQQMDACTPDLFMYSAGIGELLDPTSMEYESRVIDVNLHAMIRAAAIVVPAMVKRKKGHIIGISSLADDLISAEAPSYHASKAGFSNYLGGLALALRPHGVYVTNIRFGFVDTKMAKGGVKPFMMSVKKAVDHIERCIEKKPAVYTAPRIALPLVIFRKWMLKLSLHASILF